MPDWKKIKADYIRGTSYRKLAEKYGVSFSIISKRGMREKWTDLRKQTGKKAETKIVESIADQQAKRAVKLYDTAEMLLRKIATQIADAEQSGLLLPYQEVAAYSTALERLQRVLSVKSDKDLEEQQARINKLRKEAMIEEKTQEIKVVISDDLEEYSE